MSGSDVGYVIPTTTTSSVTLSISPNPVKFGKKVKFTATVNGDPFTLPTGTIIFIIDGVAQNPVELDQFGRATFSTSSLPPVQHIIEAKYSGDFTYFRSTSGQMALRVKPPTCF